MQVRLKGQTTVLVVGLQLQKFFLRHNCNSCSWIARLRLQRYYETTTAETGILSNAYVYLRRVDDVDGPLRTLRAFQRVLLQPGERKVVTLDMPRQNFETWDDAMGTMRVVPGRYELMAGTSSAEADLQTIMVNIK